MKSKSFAFATAGVGLVALVAGCAAGDIQPTASSGPVVGIAYAQSSPAFRDLPPGHAEDDEEGTPHAPLRAFAHRGVSAPTRVHARDVVLQSAPPMVSMPGALLNLSGQADTAGVAPADTNGAVGPNHYVQTVNLSTEIWNKDGTVAAASKQTNALWAGYTCTNSGCGCSTRNDGDPVVMYDQLADRWIITQFSLPNMKKAGGPSFQCVAVSKTADPTGAYWLYDFAYGFSINDYGKFGVWPDGYYATFNMFDAAGSSDNYAGADFCVYDRNKMLAGQTATQQCFLQAFPASTYVTCPTNGSTPPTEPFSVFGALPISLDGKIAPPLGTPGWFAQFDYSQCVGPYNTLDFWSLHVDWTTSANSKLTGPTAVTVADFLPTCYFNSSTGDCIPEPNNGLLAGLDDRVMFRFTYRNFGSHESLLVNHSVAATQTSTAVTQGGVRWYELRLPGGAPTLYQSGTYAPNDSKWRWMASIAQDQAQDIGLGFSLSSGSTNPAIGWTGRVVGDPVGTMGQGEATVDTGAGSEVGGGRWGDYSNMTVDPSDDCTFWYTQMLYGAADWQTFVADFKFPGCGANDFGISVTPSTQTLPRNNSVSYSVATTSTKGTAEMIALYVQDLPSGVTGTFNPPTVTAGASSTLTLAASSTATLTTQTFTVIGKAPSAVHAATAQVTVNGCTPTNTCPFPDNCGSVSNGCGGMNFCGSCSAPQTCVSNVCVSPPDMAMATPDLAMMPPDLAMMPPDLAMTPADLAMAAADMTTIGTDDLGTAPTDDMNAGSTDMASTRPRDMSGGGGVTDDMAGAPADLGAGGGKGGCGCDVGAANGGNPPLAAFAFVLVFAGALVRRRSRR